MSVETGAVVGTKAAPVSDAKLRVALVKGKIAGKTNADVRQELGMNEGTFNVRKSKLVKEVRAKEGEAGVEAITLKRSPRTGGVGAGRTPAERKSILELVAELNVGGDETPEVPAAEAVAETETPAVEPEAAPAAE